MWYKKRCIDLAIASAVALPCVPRLQAQSSFLCGKQPRSALSAHKLYNIGPVRYDVLSQDLPSILQYGIEFHRMINPITMPSDCFGDGIS
jgi:hypothetical protein